MVAVACVLGAGASPLAADPNCRCRLFGEYYGIGTVMCIRGSLRRCEMNQNNTSWKKIGEICPQTRLDDGILPDQPGRAYAARLDQSRPSSRSTE